MKDIYNVKELEIYKNRQIIIESLIKALQEENKENKYSKLIVEASALLMLPIDKDEVYNDVTEELEFERQQEILKKPLYGRSIERNDL